MFRSVYAFVFPPFLLVFFKARLSYYDLMNGRLVSVKFPNRIRGCQNISKTYKLRSLPIKIYVIAADRRMPISDDVLHITGFGFNYRAELKITFDKIKAEILAINPRARV